MTDILAESPLSEIGKSAAAAPDPSDSDPLLQQFNSAIAPYSTERQNMDWLLAERVAGALAAVRCDLKVYGYLGLAAFQNVGAEDSPYLPLGAVLHALGDLVENGWARCLPKSDARRQAQLKWFSEEIGALVKTKPPTPKQQPAFAACLSAAERTAELCGTALGLGYPILRELREALKEHDRALPAPTPTIVPAAVAPAPPAVTTPKVEAPPPVSVPVAAVAQSPSPPPPPAVAVSPPASQPGPTDPSQLSREALEDQLGTLVVELASQLRMDALTDPAPYWLLRALRWANHDLLRPDRVAEVLANKGRSQIPLPQGHARLSKDIARRLSAGQYAEVISECEELFALTPLWLDLQRWTATGLEALGATAARSVVRDQVDLLIRCCPQIVELKFSDRDGTPFADAETVRWLESERGNPGQNTTNSPVPSTPEQIPEGLLAGVQFLQKQIAQALSGARRFDVQLRLVDLLLANERSDIAMPIVDLLLMAVETHRLADWQPELCQRVFRLAVQTARAAELDTSRRASLWNRICQLAPADAVQLGPESIAS